MRSPPLLFLSPPPLPPHLDLSFAPRQNPAGKHREAQHSGWPHCTSMAALMRAVPAPGSICRRRVPCPAFKPSWGSTPGVPPESIPCSQHHNKQMPDTIARSFQVRGEERLPTASHPLCGLSNPVGPSAGKVSVELGEVQRQLGQERKAEFLGMSAAKSIPHPLKRICQVAPFSG